MKNPRSDGFREIKLSGRASVNRSLDEEDTFFVVWYKQVTKSGERSLLLQRNPHSIRNAIFSHECGKLFFASAIKVLAIESNMRNLFEIDNSETYSVK